MNENHRPPEVRGRTSRRSPRTGRKAVVLGLALTTPLIAAPAVAEIVPVTPPHHIEVFPSIDMAGAAGFTEPFVLEVWRNGVRVGTSGAPVDTDLLELNHDGPPCWSGVTPDIIPGDEIRVTTAETLDSADPVGEFMTVADLDADPARLVALDPDGITNDLVMTGTATTLDGTAALPLERMEAEIVQPAWRDFGWERRAMGAVPGGVLPGADTEHPDGGDGVLVYAPISPENPLGNHWTATWKNMPEPHGSLALEGEHSISYFERDDGAEGSGLTITDAEDASGPGVGCPPAASDAVTSTAPTSANIDFMDGDADMVVSGTSFNAAGGQITLDDVDGDPSDAITVPATINAPATTADTPEPVAPVRQTWTADFANADFDALADGDLRVSATFDRVIETPVETVDTTDPAAPVTTTTYTHPTTSMPGRSHTLQKDTVAPVVPTAFPGSGRFPDTQSVTISAGDEIADTVRYRVGQDATTTPDPTVGSPRVTGPISVTSSQTIKARSFDEAGNASEVAILDYEIVPLATPVAPTGVTATAGFGSARVSWTAPSDDGGSPVTGYAIEIFEDGAYIDEMAVPTANTTAAVVSGLQAGVPYTFAVKAINAQGPSAASEETAPVIPLAADSARPTVTARTPGVSARLVALASNVTATFSEDVTGVNGTSVTLRNAATGAVVPATVSYSAALRRATLNPSANLAANSRYTARLTAGIRDAAGNAITATSWSFTTGPAPRVTARTPGVNATNVARGANATATFSEPVVGVSRTTARLVNMANGRVVSATVSYAPATRRVTINPFGATTTLLPRRTRFRVDLIGGAAAIRDHTGDPLTTVRWFFTTR